MKFKTKNLKNNRLQPFTATFILLAIVLLVLILPSVSATGWNETFNSSVDGVWKFSEATGTTSTDNIKLKGGNLIGATSFITSGKNETGLGKFAGAGTGFNTTCTDCYDYNSDDAFSVSMWLNVTGAFPRAIIGKGSTEATGWHIRTTGDGDGIVFSLKGALLYKTLSLDNLGKNYSQVVVTYDGSGNNNGMLIYINGSVLAGTSSEGAIGAGTNTGNVWIGGGAGTAGGTGFTGSIDEVYFWNRTLPASEVLSLYNSGMGIFYNDPASLEVNLTSPTNAEQIATYSFNFTANYIIPDHLYNITNATYYIWNSTATIFNQTLVNVTGDTLNSTTLKVNGFLTGTTYKWNVKLCGKMGTLGSTCVWAPSNYTFDFGVKVNELSYNSQASSGSFQNFSVNLTYDPNYFSGISVKLNYNNTNYTASKSGSGNTLFYLNQINVPNVLTATNKTFYWIVILNGPLGTYNYLSSQYNQTINSFLMDDCSTYTKTLLNFSMYDETTLLPVNGTILINLNIYSYGTNNLVSSYNKSFNYIVGVGNSSSICLQNITEDYRMSYEINHYVNDSSFKRYRTIQSLKINNNTLSQNISLYNLYSSLGKTFDVIVVGNLLSSSGNSNLLVDTQRQYLNLNEFKSVESSVTSSNGIAITHLVQSDEVYNFIISYNNEVLGTFNNYRVKCQNEISEQCSITLNLAQATGTLTDFENYGNLSQIFLLDNTLHILYHTFSSTDGQTHEIESLVIKDDGYGNTTICDGTSTGTSGTIQCTIPESYRNNSFFVQTFVDGDYVGSKHFSQGPNQNWYGADIFIMLMMFSSLVMLLIGHPILIIVGAIIGLFSPILLLYVAGANFSSIIGALLFYLAGGIIAIWQISRKI